MSLLDRKNLLWESSRMFLPEHREQLLKQREQENHVSIPEWSEEKWEEIDRLIRTAYAQSFPLIFRYVRHQRLHQVYGRVKVIQPQEGWLKVIHQQQEVKIHFSELYDVEKR